MVQNLHQYRVTEEGPTESLNIVKLLIKHKADPDRDNNEIGKETWTHIQVMSVYHF